MLAGEPEVSRTWVDVHGHDVRAAVSRAAMTAGRPTAPARSWRRARRGHQTGEVEDRERQGLGGVCSPTAGQSRPPSRSRRVSGPVATTVPAASRPSRWGMQKGVAAGEPGAGPQSAAVLQVPTRDGRGVDGHQHVGGTEGRQRPLLVDQLFGTP